MITGAEDVLIPAKNAEILAQRIPGARLHIIPALGHAFFNEDPAAFLATFVPFAQSHPLNPYRRGLNLCPWLLFMTLPRFASPSARPSSRLQIAELAGDFLAGLTADEAAIAARFMVGRAQEQGEENQLQISGRAIWRVVAEMTDARIRARIFSPPPPISARRSK